MPMTNEQLDEAINHANLPYNTGNYVGVTLRALVEEVRSLRARLPPEPVVEVAKEEALVEEVKPEEVVGLKDFIPEEKPATPSKTRSGDGA